MKPEPLVTIVVINWNKIEITKRCINSIYSSRYKNYKILVIDNGSREDLEETLKSQFPKVIIIKNNENLGYTGANNQGLKWSYGNGSKYTWLLNNDAMVEPDTLNELIVHCEENPNIGLAHPIIYNNPDEKRVLYCGSYVDVINGSLQIAKDKITFEKWQNANPQHIALWGTALLVKAECYVNVGELDDRFFAYFEDMDYSMRAEHAGFRRSVVTSSAIYHDRKTIKTKDYPNYYHYFMARNNLLFWKKNQTSKKKINKFHLRYVLPKASAYYLEGAESAARATIDGSWNGYKNLFGNMEYHLMAPAIIHIIIKKFPRLIAKLTRVLL